MNAISPATARRGRAANPFADLALTRPVAEDVPLDRFTTWRIGGPARWFWEPEADELPTVLRACAEAGIRPVFLGRGSNVLVRDSGIDGLVICVRRAMTSIDFVDGTIRAEAGAPMPTVAKLAADHGFEGFEFLIGIPGSIGGGIVLNAGLTAQGQKEIASVLTTVEAVTAEGEPVHVADPATLDLGYRTSNIRERGLFVTGATFVPLAEGDKAVVKERMNRHLAERKRKQPLDKATAGSTFKQPKGGKAAGWYIEQAGLKSLARGGATVSPKHANWIENAGDASSDDIESLMRTIQERVEHRFGVLLEPEVHVLD